MRTVRLNLFRLHVLGVFVVLPLGEVNGQTPLGTGFSYQGRLDDAGAPVNDTCDFQFSLWDEAGAGDPPSGGNQVGSTQTVIGVEVSDGVFAVELNGAGEFGPNGIARDARWLEIAVRCPTGVGGFDTLAPRQAVGTVPFAQQTRGILVEEDGSVVVGQKGFQGDEHLFDFKWDQPNTRLRCRSLMLAEVADTVDLAIRRANGTLSNPIPLDQDDIMGWLYFQPFGSPGHFDAGESPFYGRTAFIHSRCAEPPTDTGRGGRLAFGVTKIGELVTRERAYFDHDGKFMLLGRASAEDNSILSTTQGPQASFPAGWLTVLGPDTTVDPTLSLRQTNAPSFGFDFDLESNAVGRLDLNRVNSGTRTQVLSVMRNTGRIGIATTNPTNVLTIAQGAGSAIADGWQTHSSRKWKENVSPLADALQKVKRLRGVRFDWKTSGKSDIGLIAEEVAEVVPEVVGFAENGKDARSVDYARLAAVLIEAVKTQQAQIDDMERRYQNVARQLEELRSARGNIMSDAVMHPISK